MTNEQVGNFDAAVKSFSRATIADLPATTDKSEQYWRSDARSFFEHHPELDHYLMYRCKSSAIADGVIARGAKTTNLHGLCVIIASSGGRYGKSRKTFMPSK